MKKILLVTVCCGLIVSGYFFGKQSVEEALNNIRLAEIETKNETISELERLTLELKQQNFLLTKNLELAASKLQSNVRKQADVPVLSSSNQQIVEQTNDDKPLPIVENHTIADVMRHAMKSGVSIHKKLTENFEIQETDFDWAPEQENNLRDVIAANDKLDSYGVIPFLKFN
ncbi:MAG: hypothetical protein HAW66_06075 [Shewanella sp.]|nr:hypothetical protein [Shewanella sp.]